MKLKKYKVVYLPFAQSDLESEMILYASDEEEARKVFERTHPSEVFKSAQEM